MVTFQEPGSQPGSEVNSSYEGSLNNQKSLMLKKLQNNDHYHEPAKVAVTYEISDAH